MLSLFKVDTNQLLQEKFKETLPRKLSGFIEYIKYNVKKGSISHISVLSYFIFGKMQAVESLGPTYLSVN